MRPIIAAAQEMREAARYWEPESRTDAEHASWPQNKVAAQRYLDALAAWDRLAIPLAICQCGRPAFYAVNDPTPYCPSCEYQACATCDCVPERH